MSSYTYPLTSYPFTFIVYLPHFTSGVRHEVRCFAEAEPLYTYIYTYTNYVY